MTPKTCQQFIFLLGLNMSFRKLQRNRTPSDSSYTCVTLSPPSKQMPGGVQREVPGPEQKSYIYLLSADGSWQTGKSQSESLKASPPGVIIYQDPSHATLHRPIHDADVLKQVQPMASSHEGSRLLPYFSCPQAELTGPIPGNSSNCSLERALEQPLLP